MLLVGCIPGIAHDPAIIVYAESNATPTSSECAQVSHIPILPYEGLLVQVVSIIECICTTYDLPIVVYTVGTATIIAWERAKIDHTAILPEKRMSVAAW